MSVQKKGHEAAMSKFNVAKRTLANFEMQHARLSEAVARDSVELAKLPEKITAAKRALDTEVAKIAAEQAPELSRELAELTALMDSAGATPEREGRLFQILAAGRMSKLVGQGYEMQKLMILRIKNPRVGHDFKVRWSVFNGWLRPPQQAA